MSDNLTVSGAGGVYQPRSTFGISITCAHIDTKTGMSSAVEMTAEQKKEVTVALKNIVGRVNRDFEIELQSGTYEISEGRLYRVQGGSRVEVLADQFAFTGIEKDYKEIFSSSLNDTKFFKANGETGTITFTISKETAKQADNHQKLYKQHYDFHNKVDQISRNLDDQKWIEANLRGWPGDINQLKDAYAALKTQSSKMLTVLKEAVELSESDPQDALITLSNQFDSLYPNFVNSFKVAIALQQSLDAHFSSLGASSTLAEALKYPNREEGLAYYNRVTGSNINMNDFERAITIHQNRITSPIRQNLTAHLETLLQGFTTLSQANIQVGDAQQNEIKRVVTSVRDQTTRVKFFEEPGMQRAIQSEIDNQTKTLNALRDFIDVIDKNEQAFYEECKKAGHSEIVIRDLINSLKAAEGPLRSFSAEMKALQLGVNRHLEKKEFSQAMDVCTQGVQRLITTYGIQLVSLQGSLQSIFQIEGTERGPLSETVLGFYESHDGQQPIDSLTSLFSQIQRAPDQVHKLFSELRASYEERGLGEVHDSWKEAEESLKIALADRQIIKNPQTRKLNTEVSSRSFSQDIKAKNLSEEQSSQWQTALKSREMNEKDLQELARINDEMGRILGSLLTAWQIVNNAPNEDQPALRRELKRQLELVAPQLDRLADDFKKWGGRPRLAQVNQVMARFEQANLGKVPESIQKVGDNLQAFSHKLDFINDLYEDLAVRMLWKENAIVNTFVSNIQVARDQQWGTLCAQLDFDRKDFRELSKFMDDYAKAMEPMYLARKALMDDPNNSALQLAFKKKAQAALPKLSKIESDFNEWSKDNASFTDSQGNKRTFTSKLEKFQFAVDTYKTQLEEGLKKADDKSKPLIQVKLNEVTALPSFKEVMSENMFQVRAMRDLSEMKLGTEENCFSSFIADMQRTPQDTSTVAEMKSAWQAAVLQKASSAENFQQVSQVYHSISQVLSPVIAAQRELEADPTNPTLKNNLEQAIDRGEGAALQIHEMLKGIATATSPVESLFESLQSALDAFLKALHNKLKSFDEIKKERPLSPQQVQQRIEYQARLEQLQTIDLQGQLEKFLTLYPQKNK